MQAYFQFMLRLSSHEMSWCALSGMSASLLCTGLLLTWLPLTRTLGLTARILGLAGAGFFFTTLGLSYLLGNAESVASVPFLMLGLSAWALLFRGPASPGTPP